MDLSFFLPTSGDHDPLHRAAALGAFAAEAEEAGYHSLWCVDHLLPTDGHQVYAGLTWLDPLLSLAAVAGHTSLPLGTIYCGVLRHPVVAAKQIATLTSLAPGRVILGLTSGWAAREHRAVGMDPAGKADRADEWLAAVTRLLTGAGVSGTGPTWPFADVTIEPRPEVLPAIWQTGGSGGYGLSAGGAVPRRLLDRIAAADGWCVSAMSTVEKAEADRAQVLDRLARDGRDAAGLTVSHVNYVHLVETGDREEALAVQRPLWSGGTASVAVDADSPVFLTGTVDDVVDKLHRRHRAGIDVTMLQAFPGHHAEQLRLCARHLLPAVRAFAPRPPAQE